MKSLDMENEKLQAVKTHNYKEAQSTPHIKKKKKKKLKFDKTLG